MLRYYIYFWTMRMLLLPFAWIYGWIIRLRNVAFDWGILKQTSFDLPIICIGNLTTGGTGKSPMTLYLAGILSEKYKVAILSRGYGRESKGFKWVNKESLAREVGDEPLQYANSNLPLMVAVCESRVEGIRKILSTPDVPDLILLDDAFQHRWVKAGFNILLSDFNVPFYKDYLLPAGNLREPISSLNRADVVVVTKCPFDLSENHQVEIAQRMKLSTNQSLHFSYIHYRDTLPGMISGELHLNALKNYSVFLFCGIAQPVPLIQFLEKNTSSLKTRVFPDHHAFSVGDAIQLKNEYLNLKKNHPVVLLTTRKDLMRIMSKEIQYHLKELPVFILDIEPMFIDTAAVSFNESVFAYMNEKLKGI